MCGEGCGGVCVCVCVRRRRGVLAALRVCFSVCSGGAKVGFLSLSLHGTKLSAQDAAGAQGAENLGRN